VCQSALRKELLYVKFKIKKMGITYIMYYFFNQINDKKKKKIGKKLFLRKFTSSQAYLFTPFQEGTQPTFYVVIYSTPPSASVLIFFLPMAPSGLKKIITTKPI
jgi:hypothetical protein